MNLRIAGQPEIFYRMAAQALNCPNCGAAASSTATRCEHCHSRLATVACPACFGLNFLGEKFCSHCGVGLQRLENRSDSVITCPRCRVNTKVITLAATELRECSVCEGIWVETSTLQRICTERERQAAILGSAAPLPTAQIPLERVRYIPCPVCRQLMHRVNFAKCSAVIVDVCKAHGTWFDKDELHRIVQFISAGGFDKARAMEIAELEEKRRSLEATRASMANSPPASDYSSRHSLTGLAIETALDGLLNVFFH